MKNKRADIPKNRINGDDDTICLVKGELKNGAKNQYGNASGFIYLDFIRIVYRFANDLSNAIRSGASLIPVEDQTKE